MRFSLLAAVLTLLLFPAIAFPQEPAPPPQPPPPVEPPKPPPGPTLEEQAKVAGEKGLSLETGLDLAGPEVVADESGALNRDIKVPAGDLLPDAFMADGGQTLFIAERSGVVRKILLPGLREERRMALGVKITTMKPCKPGILVSVPESKEIWLMRENDLKVIKKFPVREASIISSPQHGEIAYAALTIRGLPIELDVVDLETGRATRPIVALELLKQIEGKPKYRKHPTSNELSTFEDMLFTPRGDMAFCRSGNSIFRLELNGDKMAIEEASPAVGKFRHIAISPDSVWIGLASSDEKAAGLPELKPYGTWVFKTKDLQKVEYSIAELHVWGFTRGGEKVFGVRDPGTFLMQDKRGKVYGQCDVTKNNGDVKAIVAHPDGVKFLVLTSARAIWVWLK